jgi:alkanesulfonate monooxygenase SsuD/methylene tetrahydromethanopterin reductase-like flavin-dependent oxidoreductase (luciferase family)
VRFILSLGNGGPTADPRTLGDLAALAESSGWDAIALEDYLVYQNRPNTPTFDPWVSLAAMAMRTTRIRLGTLVTPLARRHVGKLAAETVAIDHLSGGRLFLGVGVGDEGDVAFGGFGDHATARERAARVDETLEVLVRLWSGEPVSYQGRYVQVEDVRLVPPPVQRPRIPIWIGGQYPKRAPIRRAARWDGSCLFIPTASYPTGQGQIQRDWTPQDLDDFRASVATLRPAEAPPLEIIVGGRERQSDWDAERALIAALAAAGATWWQEWIAPTDLETTRAAIARGPLR